MPFFNNKRKDFSIQPPKQEIANGAFTVTDSANIDFTYANNNLTANLIPTGITAGTYGSSTLIPILTLDIYGRVIGVSTVPISGGGGTYTVNNGLTESPANNFQLGGTLIQNTTIDADTFLFDITGTDTLVFKVANTNAVSGTGAFFSSLIGNAIAALSNGSQAIYAQTTANIDAIRGITKFNGTGDVTVLKIDRIASSSGGVGIGASASIDTGISLSTTIPPAVSSLKTRWTGTSSYTWELWTTSSGVLSLKLKMLPTGQLQLLNYGTGTPFTGIVAKALGVDSSGNVIEFTPATGGGTVTSVATAGLISGGPITTSGTITTLMNTNKLVGRGTPGTGIMEEITLGTGLSLSGNTLNATASGGGLLHGTTSGTDTYTVTITGATAYTDGDAYLIRFANGNTTSATLNINGQGAIPLYRNNDGPLLGGDVLSGGEMICVYNSTLNIFQCIGISPNSLVAYVTNDDSVTITKGMPVYAFSGVGDRMTVKRAFNTSDATSAQTVGLVLSTSIGVNQKGLIMMQGLLDGLSILPTATWNDGDPVYLGTTPGSITPTKQYAPNHLVYLGFVTTANNGSAGRMYVRVQNGFELDELHNVQAQTPANNDTLYYDNTVTPKQWKTASIATILGYTPLSQTLANTNIFVGNASNIATAVAMSGDTTIANTGVVTLKNNLRTGSFGVTIDGVTSVIQVGQVGYVVIPYAGTITGWSITANIAGNVQFDIWKATSAIPLSANSIIGGGGNYPALSASQFITSTTMTSWTTTFAAGDVFGFYINSASTIKNATLTLRCNKT